MVCDIQKIDWKTYTREVDVNQLWGEIYAAFLVGEDTEFTTAQASQSEKNNQKYEIVDPIEIVMNDQFIIKPGDNNLWTSSAEIMYVVQDKLGKGGSPKSFQMALASTCKKIGLEKGRQSGQQGYFGIRSKLP
jgi:predicted P-loop ATPase